MLAELMLPEALVVSLVILPVSLHILEGSRCALGQNRTDVCILSARIAVLLIRPITVIGPMLNISKGVTRPSLVTPGQGNKKLVP
jgi:hypothetical protein